MAKVVGGFASSHTPLMYMEGKDWGKRGEQDRRNRELIKMPEGKRVTYDELEALADPAIAEGIDAGADEGDARLPDQVVPAGPEALRQAAKTFALSQDCFAAACACHGRSALKVR